MSHRRIIFIYSSERWKSHFSMDELRLTASELSMVVVAKDIGKMPVHQFQEWLSKSLDQTSAEIMVTYFCGDLSSRDKSLFGWLDGMDNRIPVISLLASLDVDELETIFSTGMDDFVAPPFRCHDITLRAWRLINHFQHESHETRNLKQRMGLERFVGKSQALIHQLKKVPRFATCDAHVLIQGETGTGKELVARAIHYLSPRSTQPFVAVNCGALPVDLIENELYGHEKGAYTSAAGPSAGLIREAEGGTLFLDEIDTMPLMAQVKFLRFVQENEYRPLGSKRTVRANVRLIAASNSPLEESVAAGQFRHDLLYRLNVLPVSLPPLRNRLSDVPLLAWHFLRKYSAKFKRPARSLSPMAMQKLQNYSWPGNVRELENVIERSVVLTDGPEIKAKAIQVPEQFQIDEVESFQTLKAKAVEQFERRYIQHALDISGGNISQAARFAKKNRRSFWELMRKYQIKVKAPGSDRLSQPPEPHESARCFDRNPGEW